MGTRTRQNTHYGYHGILPVTLYRLKDFLWRIIKDANREVKHYFVHFVFLVNLTTTDSVSILFFIASVRLL